MNFESMMTISNVFHQHIAKQKNMKLAMIHDAVKFHYDNCSEYKIFCESQGFKPEDLKEYEDLKKVPLIPIDTFKDPEHRMLSIPRKKIRGVVESSGTSGIPSIAFKDTQILFRDVIALIVQYTEFIDIFGDFGMFFLVSPTDMPTLGASKCSAFYPLF